MVHQHDHRNQQELSGRINQIERKTGAAVTMELTKVTPPIVNSPGLVERGKAIGTELIEDNFYLGDKPFLVGDNAAQYMEQAPGMRVVFLADKRAKLPILFTIRCSILMRAYCPTL